MTDLSKRLPTVDEMRAAIRERHAAAVRHLKSLRDERARINEQIAKARDEEAEAARLARALEPRKRKATP